MRQDTRYILAAAAPAAPPRAVPCTRQRRGIGFSALAPRILALAALFATGLDVAPLPPDHASSVPAAAEGDAYRAASARAASATRARSEAGASTTQSAPYFRISITSS